MADWWRAQNKEILTADPDDFQIGLDSLAKEIRRANVMVLAAERFPDAPREFLEQLFVLRTQLEVLRTKCLRLRTLNPVSQSTEAGEGSGAVPAPT